MTTRLARIRRLLWVEAEEKANEHEAELPDVEGGGLVATFGNFQQRTSKLTISGGVSMNGFLTFMFVVISML
jgi:hypothetical protein